MQHVAFQMENKNWNRSRLKGKKFWVPHIHPSIWQQIIQHESSVKPSFLAQPAEWIASTWASQLGASCGGKRTHFVLPFRVGKATNYEQRRMISKKTHAHASDSNDTCTHQRIFVFCVCKTSTPTPALGCYSLALQLRRDSIYAGPCPAINNKRSAEQKRLPKKEKFHNGSYDLWETKRNWTK